MAASTTYSASTRFACEYGRSGYNNKPDDDEDNKLKGRSGYNKGGDDDDEDKYKLNFGRSGYNKGGDDDDEE